MSQGTDCMVKLNVKHCIIHGPVILQVSIPYVVQKSCLFIRPQDPQYTYLEYTNEDAYKADQ
jgi:hypothetical protein